MMKLPPKPHSPWNWAIRQLKARAIDSITFHMLPKPLLGRSKESWKAQSQAGWGSTEQKNDQEGPGPRASLIGYLLKCLPKSYPSPNEVVPNENPETLGCRQETFSKSLKAINFKWSQLYQSCGYNFLLTLIITFQQNICLKKAKSLHYFLFLAWLQKYSLI